MPLFSRADYEFAVEQAEELRAQARRLCAKGKLDGFKYKRIDEECDDAIKAAENSLRFTRQVLREREMQQQASKPQPPKPATGSSTLKKLGKNLMTYHKE
jgi:hypothetical protein